MADQRRAAHLEIEGHDSTGRATHSAGANFDQLDRKLRKFDGTTGKLDKTMSKMGVRLEKIAQTGMRFGSRIAAGMAVAVAGVQAFLKAGLVTIQYGPKIAGALAMIGASLAPLALAYKFTALTFQASSDQILKSLTPITTGFTKAADAAAKLAWKGVRPIAQEFMKANLPAIRGSLESINASASNVVGSFLDWASTRQGVRVISNLLDNINSFIMRLERPVSAVARSFVEMSSRISGVALRKWGDALAYVLVKLSNFMDQVSAKDVRKAFDDIERIFKQGERAARAFGNALEWVGTHEKEITAIRVALAAVAIVLGILSGTWLPAIAGALILVTTFWRQLGGAVGVVVAAFQNFVTAHAPQIQAAIGAIKDGFARFVAQVGPQIRPLLNELNHAWQEMKPLLVSLIPIIGIIAQVFLGLLGAAVQALILLLRGLIATFRAVVNILKVVWQSVLVLNKVFLSSIASMLRAAAGALDALGMHKAADKLRVTAGKIDQTAARIQSSIDALHGKTIPVVVKFSTVGYKDTLGIVRHFSLNAPSSVGRTAAGHHWQNTLSGSGGTARAGGPSSINVAAPVVETTVMIDGQALDARIRNIIIDEGRRNAHHARVGRR